MISSFTPETIAGIYVLYFTVDLFLFLGALGLFRSRFGKGLLGMLGGTLMLLAVLVLIARDLGVVSAATYAIGAALFSLGLDLFAIQLLLNRRFPSWIPVAWILSTIVGSI